MNMKLKVIAVSSNSNSFGLVGHVVMNRQGRAWEVGRSICSPDKWSRGQVIEAPLDLHEREIVWGFLGCEIPRELPKAPAKVIKAAWAL